VGSEILRKQNCNVDENPMACDMKKIIVDQKKNSVG